jgi:hypothetical protein
MNSQSSLSILIQVAGASIMYSIDTIDFLGGVVRLDMNLLRWLSLVNMFSDINMFTVKYHLSFIDKFVRHHNDLESSVTLSRSVIDFVKKVTVQSCSISALVSTNHLSISRLCSIDACKYISGINKSFEATFQSHKEIKSFLSLLFPSL